MKRRWKKGTESVVIRLQTVVTVPVFAGGLHEGTCGRSEEVLVCGVTGK